MNTVRVLLASLAAALGVAAGAPGAAQVPPAALPQPLAFEGYRAWAGSEPAALDWRAVNERVAAVGGWRAYLKQVREAQAAPPATAPAAPTGAPAKPQ